MDTKSNVSVNTTEIPTNITVTTDLSTLRNEEDSIMMSIWHTLRFLSKFIGILPFKMTYYLIKVVMESERGVNIDIVSRIFMRESTKLIDENICQYVLNPIFEFIYKFEGNGISLINYSVPNDDLEQISGGIFDKPFVKSTRTQSKFFWKRQINPHTFNPEIDPILIYYPGGGYALQLTPTTLSFLTNTGKYFPDMPILISDYATTASKLDSNKYPRQLLDILAVYDYVTQSLGCKNVIVMGDSAGGNAVLVLLLYLHKHNRPLLPRKAIPISPWLNTTYIGEQERTYMKQSEKWDGICTKGSEMFGDLYIPKTLRESGYNPDNDEYINIEHNFDAETWNLITEKCDLLVTYGDDEILSYQIKLFVDKLIECNPKRYNNVENVLAHFQGCHTGPILAWDGNVESWSKQTMIKPILDFIDKA